MVKERKHRVPYSTEVADDILECLSVGVSMREICDEEDMPSRQAVHFWCLKDEDFAEKVTLARRLGMNFRIDELIGIADDSGGDYEIKKDNAGNDYVHVNNESVQRSRVMIDTRKWVLAKMYNDIYGDKIAVKTTDDLDNLTDEQLQKKIDAAEKKLADGGTA